MFEATVKERFEAPDGRIEHATVRINDSVAMIGEPPGDCEPAPPMCFLFLPDVDATYRRALEAGGTSVREPQTHLHGDRNGAVSDPIGNTWWIAAHVENVAPGEIARRAAAQTQGEE